MAEEDRDLLIVGAGFAGLAAAYAARGAGRRVCLVERDPAPVQRIGSSVLSPEAASLLSSGLGLDPRAFERAPGVFRGLRLHVPPHRSVSYVEPEPALNIDRAALMAAMEERCEAEVLRGWQVEEVEQRDGGAAVTIRSGTEERTLTAPMAVLASGCEVPGTPQGAAQEWPGIGGVRHFIGRVRLTAEVPDPGWRELLFGPDYLGFFYGTETELVVEAAFRQARDWRFTWPTMLAYLTGSREIRILREREATFHWARRCGALELGEGSLLRAGDAAGATDILGYGLAGALETGLAAGRCATEAGPEPLIDRYRAACAPLLSRREAERRLKVGEDDPGESGFLRAVKAAPLPLRWLLRRSLRRSLARWTAPSDPEAAEIR